jgi:hypothetical protein
MIAETPICLQSAGLGAQAMTTGAASPGYSHTQKAPLCLILYGSALACMILAWMIGETHAWMIGETQGIYIAGGVSLVLTFLAAAFHHLSVEDQGEVLAIRFGPIPLFRRTVRYAEIENVEVGRTLLIDGWGIHMSIQGVWVWNLWGRECVVVHLRNGGVLRIGTDDAAELARFLKQKVSRHL